MFTFVQFLDKNFVCIYHFPVNSSRPSPFTLISLIGLMKFIGAKIPKY